jgi:hypothetical protein
VASGLECAEPLDRAAARASAVACRTGAAPLVALAALAPVIAAASTGSPNVGAMSVAGAAAERPRIVVLTGSVPVEEAAVTALAACSTAVGASPPGAPAGGTLRARAGLGTVGDAGPWLLAGGFELARVGAVRATLGLGPARSVLELRDPA